MTPFQMNTRLNHSIIASLSLISLLGLAACSSSSEDNTNNGGNPSDGGPLGEGGSNTIVGVPGTGGSGGTSSNPLSSTVTNGTTFFNSEPACFCPPSNSYCAGIVVIIDVPLNAVNEGVPGYQYCFLVNPSTYTCWNCADAG